MYKIATTLLTIVVFVGEAFAVPRGNETDVFKNMDIRGTNIQATNAAGSFKEIIAPSITLGGVSRDNWPDGAITNVLSSDGSIVWRDSGGTQPDGSVTNFLYSQGYHSNVVYFENRWRVYQHDHVDMLEWGSSTPIEIFGGAYYSDGVNRNFIFGGANSSGNPITNVWRFNIVADQWVETLGLPMPIAQAAVAVRPRPEGFYVIGGSDNAWDTMVHCYTNVYMLECENDEVTSYTETAGLPQGVAAGAALYRAEAGKIFHVGGFTNDAAGVGTAITNLYAFNGDTQIWTELNGLPAPRKYLGVFEQDGLFYAFGGRDDAGNACSEVWRYSDDDNSWTEMTEWAMPEPRFAFGYVRTDNLIESGVLYVIGGARDPEAAVIYASTNVYAFDFNTELWTELTAMSEQRLMHFAGFYNGFLLAAGGLYYSEATGWQYCTTAEVGRAPYSTSYPVFLGYPPQDGYPRRLLIIGQSYMFGLMTLLDNLDFGQMCGTNAVLLQTAQLEADSIVAGALEVTNMFVQTPPETTQTVYGEIAITGPFIPIQCDSMENTNVNSSIAAGSSAGQTIILQGQNDNATVTLTNNPGRVVLCDGGSFVFKRNSVMQLIWNNDVWVELNRFADAALLKTGGKTITNTIVEGASQGTTNTLVFINGQLTSWKKNGVEQ